MDDGTATPIHVSRSNPGISPIAHHVKPPLSSQKSTNPLRMLSLRTMYVHACKENNILFAYCAPFRCAPLLAFREGTRQDADSKLHYLTADG